MEIASLKGVLTLGRSILQVASDIEDLADDWFTVTKEYELKVDSLRMQIDFFAGEMAKHGVPMDHSMVKTLQTAEEWLKTEESKVKQLNESIYNAQCCGIGWWLFAKVTMITFPQKLERTLKRVTDEIDKITENFKLEAEMADHIRKWKDGRPVQSTSYNNDGLYVPITESQEHVEAAIERFANLSPRRSDLLDRRSDSEQVVERVIEVAYWWPPGWPKKPYLRDSRSDSEQVERATEASCASWSPQRPYLRDHRWSNPTWWPLIILLHGGIGQGKSALARYVCALYAEPAKRGNGLFEHVILVSCGNCSIPDPVKKQSDILKRLNPLSTSASLKNGESDSEARIEGALRDFLSSKRVLIILDDVSDQTFLRKMWAAAQGSDLVKYLVTSRTSDLCIGLEETSYAIHMGDPTPNEARKILANHARFEETIIPVHLKEIAEKMINATEGNPLALACLTSNVAHRQDRENKRAWQETLSALYNILDKPVSNFVFGQTHDPETPWASMSSCIGSLTDGAKVILLLMYACGGQSIPEAVLRLLYSPLKKTSFAFFKSRTDLSTRDFLKQSPSTLALGKDQMEEYVQESRAWSLRSLVKLYMDWDLAGTAGNEQWTSEIVSGEESRLKTQLKNVIRDLLGDDAFRSGEGAAIGILESKKSERDTVASTSKEDRVKGKQKSHMEGDLELEANTAYRKLNSQLGEVNSQKRVIAALCALYFDQTSSHTPFSFNPDRPFAAEVVATAARWACKVSKISDSIDTTNNLRKRKAVEPIIWLLDLLQADNGKSATWTSPLIDPVRQVFVMFVCEGQVDYANIRILLDCTTYPPAPILILATIALIFSQEKTPLLSTRHLSFLSAIVRLLEPDVAVQSSIREAASEALFHISKKGETVALNTPSLLAVLVRSIEDSLGENIEATLESMDHNSSLLQNAKGALKYAAAGGRSIKRQILGVREESYQNHEPIKRQILGVGGESFENPTPNEGAVIAGLDSMDHNPIVLQNVVGILMNLASGPDSMKQQISNQHGALGVLVKCLWKDRNPSVQEHAVGAFMNLALGEEPVQSKILDEDGAIAGLVGSLSNKYNPISQARAAATLRDLAHGGEIFISKIANERGALGGLVEALSKDQNQGLQANAAGALQNLAYGEEQIKLRILDEKGALAGLVNSLSKVRNPILQEKAAGTLRNLATVGESSKPRILIQDGAVAGLVNCLFIDNNSALQQSAVEALLNLAGGGDSIKLQILKEERALAGLVESLSKDHNRILQEKAAGALSNLARGGESIKFKILNEKDQALAGIVRSLSKDQNPVLQENAAGALLNLAAGSQSIKSKILNEEDAVLLGLVKALSKAHNPGLQENALGALLNLALGEEEIKLQILNVHRALVALLKHLSTHQNPIVREYAAATMNCLENSEGYSTMLDMSDDKTLLKGAFEEFEGTSAPSRYVSPDQFRVKTIISE